MRTRGSTCPPDGRAIWVRPRARVSARRSTQACSTGWPHLAAVLHLEARQPRQRAEELAQRIDRLGPEPLLVRGDLRVRLAACNRASFALVGNRRRVRVALKLVDAEVEIRQRGVVRERGRQGLERVVRERVVAEQQRAQRAVLLETASRFLLRRHLGQLTAATARSRCCRRFLRRRCSRQSATARSRDRRLLRRRFRQRWRWGAGGRIGWCARRGSSSRQRRRRRVPPRKCYDAAVGQLVGAHVEQRHRAVSREGMPHRRGAGRANVIRTEDRAADRALVGGERSGNDDGALIFQTARAHVEEEQARGGLRQRGDGVARTGGSCSPSSL